VDSAFDDNGDPKNPMTEVAMAIMLEDLEWWGKLLAQGRQGGELVPGAFRTRAKLAELEQS